ncbi:hypothetical protein FIBSPDRAFT_847362, partial [Athelia psychrophila]
MVGWPQYPAFLLLGPRSCPVQAAAGSDFSSKYVATRAHVHVFTLCFRASAAICKPLRCRVQQAAAHPPGSRFQSQARSVRRRRQTTRTKSRLKVKRPSQDSPSLDRIKCGVPVLRGA